MLIQDILYKRHKIDYPSLVEKTPSYLVKSGLQIRFWFGSYGPTTILKIN